MRDLVAVADRTRTCMGTTNEIHSCRRDRPPRCGSSAARAASRRRSSAASATSSAGADELRRSRAPGRAARRRSRPSASYFRKTGSPGLEDEEEAAGRIDERDAAVQRKVELAICLRGRSAAAGRTCGSRHRSMSYSVTRAPVSGCDIRMDVPVYCSDPMPLSTELLEHHARLSNGPAGGSRRCGIRPA